MSYARVRRCLEAELELFATGPGGRVVRRPGVVAAIAPVAPARSLFNAVMADDAAALAAVVDELAAAYEAAGVRAWSVWSDPGDDAIGALAQRHGFVFDGAPRAMLAPLDAIAAPAVGDLDWRESDDLATFGRINDAAYGFAPPAFAAIGRLLPGWRLYLARRGGEDVGCLMVYESDDGDAGICGVATLPAAQGGGIATRLLAVALEQARGRGLTTTSLQASAKGAPVYARLGYRDLGPMTTWERRR